MMKYETHATPEEKKSKNDSLYNALDSIRNILPIRLYSGYSKPVKKLNVDNKISNKPQLRPPSENRKPNIPYNFFAKK